MADRNPAEQRVAESLGDLDVTDRLASLRGADFSTLLLAVMRQRAADVTPSDVLRRYRESRFSKPSSVRFAALREVEDQFLAALPDGWQTVVTSPVVPFATHAAMANVSQDRVLATVRGNEAAADPTTALALEAAVHRRAEPEAVTKLATIQRVVRGQLFGESAPSHFSLFALVTAGRDTGGHEFETAALIEHLTIHAAGARALGASNVRIRLTDLTGTHREPMFQQVEEAFRSAPDVQVLRDPDRQGGRGYYENVAFKVRAVFADEDLEVSDGGDVRWTARVLNDRREHAFSSGTGLDRLAARKVDGALLSVPEDLA